MIFTFVFWLIVALLLVAIEHKIVIVPSLDAKLITFVSERLDVPLAAFQFAILVGLAGIITLFPIVDVLVKLIREEAVRLYYTMSAAAASLALVTMNLGQAFLFIGFGLILPLLFVYLDVFGDLRRGLSRN